MMEDIRNNLDTSQQVDASGNRQFSNPNDEFKYWLRQDRSEDAKFINEVFSKIARFWNEIDRLKFLDLKESFDETLKAIDEIWQKSEAYNELDITRLIENFSSQIIYKFQEELKESTIYFIKSGTKPPA